MPDAESHLKRLREASAGAFAHLDARVIARGLEHRLESPYRIDQGGSSLCGPTSLFYCVAHDNPAGYGGVVADLFLDGEARYVELEIRPGRSCRAFRPDNKTRIHPCDWVALASLKDSSNHVLAYDSPRDQFSGITMPGRLEKWLRAAGYANVVNRTRLVLRGSQSMYDEAMERHRAGERVCLFVHDRLFRKRGGFPFEPWPNHWVVLTEAGTPEDLRVFSWGRTDRRVVAPEGKDAASAVRRRFYGFVAATPQHG